jgi:hypothetical protein
MTIKSDRVTDFKLSRKTGGWFLLYFVLSLLLSWLIFLPTIDNYFASDDWPAILRNTTFSWQALPTWFTQLRAGWYRPVHDLFIYMCWWLFELNPVGYRLVTLAVYALVAASVGLLMDVVTRDRRIGLLSVLLFSAFATHAEPVLWFAGTNELLAGLFVLISVIGYILYRETNAYGLIIVAVLSGFLAFASKETSLFFPSLLIIYDLLLFLKIERKRRHWTFFLPFVPIAILWLGFLLFRLPMGSSYTDAVNMSPLGMVKNLVYYILIGIFLLPNNYAFLSALPLWRAAPGLPVAILALSTSIVVILVFVWLRLGLLANKRYRNSLLFTLAWFIFALGPVIFVVTERAIFLSSIGIVSTFSVLIVGAWDASKNHRVWLKGTVTVILVLYFGLNLFVLTYRSMWFERSADLNQTVMAQLEQRSADLKPDTSVLIANLPDHTQHTFTFRNTFPSAVELHQYPINVVPILDIELAGKSPQEQSDYVEKIVRKTDSDIVFWYRNGQLILQQ